MLGSGSRRLDALARHLVPRRRGAAATQAEPDATAHPQLNEDAARVRSAFGGQAKVEPLCVLPNGQVFGVRISGINALAPLRPEQAQACVESFYRHRMLCIPAQDTAGALTKERYERLANHFGAPLPHPSIGGRTKDYPAMQTMTNVVPENRALRLGQPTSTGDRTPDGRPSFPFHADINYETLPVTSSLMLCVKGPRHGIGATELCDMLSAWHELPEDLREAALRVRVRRRHPGWFTRQPQVSIRSPTPLLAAASDRLVSRQPDGKVINLVELGKIQMSKGHENETEHIVHDHHTLAGRRTLYMPGASAGNDHWWADVGLPAPFYS